MREPLGLVWTRTSVRRYDGRIVPTKDPLGRDLFWFAVTLLRVPTKAPIGGPWSETGFR
jgi:5'-nucleotidase